LKVLAADYRQGELRNLRELRLPERRNTREPILRRMGSLLAMETGTRS